MTHVNKHLNKNIGQLQHEQPLSKSGQFIQVMFCHHSVSVQCNDWQFPVLDRVGSSNHVSVNISCHGPWSSCRTRKGQFLGRMGWHNVTYRNMWHCSVDAVYQWLSDWTHLQWVLGSTKLAHAVDESHFSAVRGGDVACYQITLSSLVLRFFISKLQFKQIFT